MTINETCRCTASINVEGEPDWVEQTIATFREAHAACRRNSAKSLTMDEISRKASRRLNR